MGPIRLSLVAGSRYGKGVNRVVIHYHEIALKRGNRSMFVNQLVDNIWAVLRGTGIRKVRPLFGRIAVVLRPEAERDEILARLARVPGIVNFSLAWRAERIVDDIIDVSLAAVGDRREASFAVRAKRGDKSFPVPSMQLAGMVGEAIGRTTGMKVNLNHPALTVYVEVASSEVLISLDKIPGVGGLPVGTGGHVLALLSGGIDSPVGAFRMIRRGCRADFIHFHGAPFQDRTSQEKAAELAEVLTRYQLKSRLHHVAFGEIQRQIVSSVERPYRVVLYRRMMMRIAEALAREIGAKALVTGESLGQVASQTLDNMAVVGNATSLPLLRPLVGMDKLEISDEARRIGTFDISTRPDQDCCQLFVPKHPATSMKLEQAERAEENLDVAALVAEALRTIETIDFRYPPQASEPASTQEGHDEGAITGAENS